MSKSIIYAFGRCDWSWREAGSGSGIKLDRGGQNEMAEVREEEEEQCVLIGSGQYRQTHVIVSKCWPVVSVVG